MSLEKIIIPAIIARTQEELDEKLSKVADYFKLIQLDIMDDKFVPNSSLNFDFKIPKLKCKFEAHLMMENPKNWIDNFSDKVNMILVHSESVDNYHSIIDLARKKNKQIGFVLNPESKVSKISDILDEIDQVLIMTVNPGFYGNPFLPKILEKISVLRKIKPNLNIEVDGGITDKTIKSVKNAGANMFVSGSYIVKSQNIKESINKLTKEIN